MSAKLDRLLLDQKYPMGYTARVIEIRQTDEYSRWFDRLRDRKARFRILTRIRRRSIGNAGDVRPVGEGISELRTDYGHGYRVYFIQKGTVPAILLAGGDKSTQERDIERAKKLAQNL